MKYWKLRLDYFGEKKAFKPLTLANIYDDDEGEEALRKGFLKIVPLKHSTGRTILYCNTGLLDRTKYSREMLIRFVWYQIHVALEDPETQRKGIIGVFFIRTTKISEVEKKILYMAALTVKGSVPIRLSSMHLCHTPAFIKFIFPFGQV